MKRGPLSPRSAGVVVNASNSSARLVDVRNSRDVRGSFVGRSEAEEGDENVAPPAASPVAKKGRSLIHRLQLGRKARLRRKEKKTATSQGKHKNDQATSQSLITTDRGRGKNDQATYHSTTITAAVVTKPESVHIASTDASSDIPESSTPAASAERKEVTTAAVVKKPESMLVASTDAISDITKSSTPAAAVERKEITTAAVVTKPESMHITSTNASSDIPKSSTPAASAERKEITTAAVVKKPESMLVASTDAISDITKSSTPAAAVERKEITTAAVVTKPESMHITSTNASSDIPKSSTPAASAERKEITTAAVVNKLATIHMSSVDDLPPMDPRRDQSQSSNTAKLSTANSSDPPEPSSTAASNEAFRVFPVKNKHAKKTPRSSTYGKKNLTWTASIDTNERNVANVEKDDVVVLEKMNKLNGNLEVAEASCWSQATRAFMSCGTLALFEVERHGKHHQNPCIQAIAHPDIPRPCSYPATSHGVTTSAGLIDNAALLPQVRQETDIQCTNWAAFGADMAANAQEGLSHRFMKTATCTDESLNRLVEMKERALEEARKASGQATARIDELLQQLAEIKSATFRKDEVTLKKKEAADANARIINMERTIREKSIALTNEQDLRMEIERKIIQLNLAITTQREQEWMNRNVKQGIDQKISSLEFDVEAAPKLVLEMAAKDICEDLVDIQGKHSQEASSLQNLGEMLERKKTDLSMLELELQDADADADVMQIEIESFQSQVERIELLLEQAIISEQEHEQQVNEYMSNIKSIKESLMQPSSNNKTQEFGMNMKEDELADMRSVSGASTARCGQSCPASVVTVTKSYSKSEVSGLEVGGSIPNAKFNLIQRNEKSSSSPATAITVVQSTLNNEDSEQEFGKSFPNLELRLEKNVKSAPGNSDEYRPETPSPTSGGNKKLGWPQKLSAALSLSRSLGSDDANLAKKSQQLMSDLFSSFKETGSIEYSSLSAEAKAFPSESLSVKDESNSFKDSSEVSSKSENNHPSSVSTLEVSESKYWPRSQVGVSHCLCQTENLNCVLVAQSGSAEEDLILELVENIPTSGTTCDNKNVETAHDKFEECYTVSQSSSLTGGSIKKLGRLRNLSMKLSWMISTASDDGKATEKSKQLDMGDSSSITTGTGSIEDTSLSLPDKVESNSSTDSSKGSYMSENNSPVTAYSPEGLSGEVLETKSWPRSHVAVSHSLSQTDNLNPVLAAQSGSADEDLAFELGLSGEVLESKSWPRSHVGVSRFLRQTENLNPVLAAQSGSADEDPALELGLSGEVLGSESRPRSHVGVSHSLSQTENLNPVLAAQSSSADEDSALKLAEVIHTPIERVPDKSEECYTRSQSPSLRMSDKNKPTWFPNLSMKFSPSNSAPQTKQFQQVNMDNSPSTTTGTGSIENSSLSTGTGLISSLSGSDVDESNTSEYSSEDISTSDDAIFIPPSGVVHSVTASSPEGLSGEVSESKSWPRSHVDVSHSLSQTEYLNPVLSGQSGSADKDSASTLAEIIHTSIESVPGKSEECYTSSQSSSLRMSDKSNQRSFRNLRTKSSTSNSAQQTKQFQQVDMNNLSSIKNKQRSLRNLSMKSSRSNSAQQTKQFQHVDMNYSSSITTGTGSIENSYSLSTESGFYTSERSTSEYCSEDFSTSDD